MAGADQAPPELAQRVAAWLQRRPALLEKQAARAGGGYGTVGATVPRWDFAGDVSPAAAGGGGGGGTLPRPLTAPAQPGTTGTVRAGASLAAAAPDDYGGTMVRRHTDVSGHGSTAGHGGTVEVRPPAGGLGAVPPPSRLVIPSDPTQPDWTAAAAAPYSAGPGSVAAGGDGGASKQLLQDGVAAAAGGRSAPPAVGAAAEGAVTALAQLEAARPGAVRDALTEVLMQLSLASNPALASLKDTAGALFGSGGGEGGSGGGQQQGDAPDLGPLGRFLMRRWRETVARERVAHSQQWQAS